MDSQIQSNGGAQEAGRSSLHEVLAAPVRRHPDCAESGCQTCLDDHQALADFIEAKIGYSRDWLGEYRAYLDAKHIPAEVNGWASRQAFDEKNVSAFIEDWCS